MEKLHGGDIVELKDGKVVAVNDIHNSEIVVSCIERYPFSAVKRIIKKFGER